MASEPLAQQEGDLCLRIGDLTLAVHSMDPELRLRVDPDARQFVVRDAAPDVSVSASFGDLAREPELETVFDSGSLWQLQSDGRGYQFRFTAAGLGPVPYKIARCDRSFSRSEVVLHRPYFNTSEPVYPLEYPLDELLILHLLAGGRGVELHGCGIILQDGSGILFAGQSGAGKTTSARLWSKVDGVRILSDDRLVLRQEERTIWMYGTPWHGEAKLAVAARAPLNALYFLVHAPSNQAVDLSPAEAAARMFARSFVPFHNRDGLEFALAFFGDVAGLVPCRDLLFVPDRSVIPFVMNQV